MSLTKGHWASLLKIQFSLVWFLADSVKEGRKLELEAEFLQYSSNRTWRKFRARPRNRVKKKMKEKLHSKINSVQYGSIP